MPETLAPEQTTGFELERFQWSAPDRLEVEGRWFGVRGRRFVRPVLTVQVGARRKRLLALLEHKPWAPDEGAEWIAAFPWSGSQDGVGGGELEVGALTVDLPPPGGSRKRRRTPAQPSVEANPAAVEAPPEPREAEPVVRPAGETRQQLERDLAAARAEMGRMRQRYDEELRELRTAVRESSERIAELETEARESGTRADRLADEARRLRGELESTRAGSGAEIEQLREAEATARADAQSHRETAEGVSRAFEAQREFAEGSAAEMEQLRLEARRAVAEAEELREARLEALAENQRLRDAARRSAAEAERLRAASRRPGATVRRVDVAPRPVDDPQATVESPAAKPEPEPPAPDATVESPAAKPDPEPPAPDATVPYKVLSEEDAVARTMSPPTATVRRIPRPKPGTPAGEDAARREPPAPPPPSRPASARPAPGAGASRLLGDQPVRPGVLEVWGPRLVAIVLVALLLLALALIVRGIL